MAANPAQINCKMLQTKMVLLGNNFSKRPLSLCLSTPLTFCGIDKKIGAAVGTEDSAAIVIFILFKHKFSGVLKVRVGPCLPFRMSVYCLYMFSYLSAPVPLAQATQ